MKDRTTKMKERVLRLLESRPDQVYKSRELAKLLKVSNRDYQPFKKIVRQLAQEGKISRHKGARYGLPREPVEVTGVLHVKTQGYGFVLRDDGGEDVFVSQRNMGTALHRDRVKVLLWARPKGRLPEGKVQEILKRGHERIVGMIQEARTYNYVIPDELKISRDIYVSEKDRGKAQAGQKVVVEITKWSDGRRMPEGRVVDVLGYPDEKGVDILSVIHAFQLPTDFPKAVLEEVEHLPGENQFMALEHRLDLRDKLVFTVDPEDAKDFDDAVSLGRLPNGNRLLGVHIADVTHFVTAKSAVDREALRRGTSVYLVDRVIPMLPERLSNELCSLRPGQDRLAYSVMMELNAEGTVVDYQIRESIIRSAYRLTYHQAQEILDDSKGTVNKGDGNSKPSERKSITQKDKRLLGETLREMADVSRILFRGWEQYGSIDFDAPEAEVILDDRGRPVRLGIRERLQSHRIIESFMLLANRTVAEHIQWLSREKGSKHPFVYRIHERPQGEKLDEFVRFVKALGYSFDIGKRATPKKFQSLLNQVKGTRYEILVEEVALRTMMKAVYATQNVGHFGLAFKQYTHFTSPIRRYPDLTVHRLLKAYSQDGTSSVPLVAKLSSICEIATQREIVAQEAERESIRAKQVEFMEDHLGEEFDGIISGVVSFGIFVEIPEYLVEGLVHINDLDDDYYVHDELRYCLVGQTKGKVFRLGDGVRVQVVRVMRDMRKIDFILVNEAS